MQIRGWVQVEGDASVSVIFADYSDVMQRTKSHGAIDAFHFSADHGFPVTT